MNRQLWMGLSITLGLAFVQTPAHSGVACNSLEVAGQCNIFGAGHTDPPEPDGGGAGVLPASFSLPSASDGNQILAFCSVTGEASCCSGDCLSPPDGADCASGDTDITSFGGVSGVTHSGATMFLVGVFMNDDEPADPAPARLDFSPGQLGTEFDELSPALNQVFYIGDGFATGSTAKLTPRYPGLLIGQQVFHIPVGTTRLFLGFADALQFGNPTDPPGFYGDNTGALTAQFLVNTTPPVSAQNASWGAIKAIYR